MSLKEDHAKRVRGGVNVSLFEILDITVVLATCLYVSYTDTRFRKIGNRYTYGLVAFGLFGQGVLVSQGITTVLQVTWLLLGGLATAFLLYYLGIWSPGDAKLFWGVSVALPPTLYSFGPWRYPPFIIAVNTFVPYFLVMAIYILFKTTLQQKLQVLRATFTPTFLLRFTLSLVSFTGVSAILNLLLPFNLNYFSAIILFVLLFSLFDRFVEKEKQLYFLLPFAVVSGILALNDLQFYLIIIGVTALLFLILRFFVASLGDYLFVREASVQDLKAGVVPANLIVRDREGTYRTQEIAFTSFISIASRPRDAEVVMDITPEGLSEEKVSELQALAREGHLAAFDNKVKIQKAMPFAPIILLGVVLTIVSRGVFVEGLMNLLGG
jgi:Flp pilus assembly protein protease CpaA